LLELGSTPDTRLVVRFIPGHPVVTLLKGKEDAALARKSKRGVAKAKATGKKKQPGNVEADSDDEENTDDEL
jgi:hypothetical protein